MQMLSGLMGGGSGGASAGQGAALGQLGLYGYGTQPESSGLGQLGFGASDGGGLNWASLLRNISTLASTPGQPGQGSMFGGSAAPGGSGAVPMGGMTRGQYNPMMSIAQIAQTMAVLNRLGAMR